jgi:hypothetical protein
LLYQDQHPGPADLEPDSDMYQLQPNEKLNFSFFKQNFNLPSSANFCRKLKIKTPFLLKKYRWVNNCLKVKAFKSSWSPEAFAGIESFTFVHTYHPHPSERP